MVWLRYHRHNVATKFFVCLASGTLTNLVRHIDDGSAATQRAAAPNQHSARSAQRRVGTMASVEKMLLQETVLREENSESVPNQSQSGENVRAGMGSVTVLRSHERGLNASRAHSAAERREVL